MEGPTASTKAERGNCVIPVTSTNPDETPATLETEAAASLDTVCWTGGGMVGGGIGASG